LEILITFATLCFIITATPGPSTMFITSMSLKYGFRKSIYIVFGEVTGWLLYLLPTAFGLGSFIQDNTEVLVYIKYIGAVYLLYIAYQSFRVNKVGHLDDVDVRAGSNFTLYKQGFFVCISNPKVILYYAAFLPQFIKPNGDELFQIMILSIIDLSIGFIIYSGYAYATDKIKMLLSNDFMNKYINKVISGVYVTLAIAILGVF
jgi:threonine/homoserine/homoserine lactone efflux protein